MMLATPCFARNKFALLMRVEDRVGWGSAVYLRNRLVDEVKSVKLHPIDNRIDEDRISSASYDGFMKVTLTESKNNRAECLVEFLPFGGEQNTAQIPAVGADAHGTLRNLAKKAAAFVDNMLLTKGM